MKNTKRIFPLTILLFGAICCSRQDTAVAASPESFITPVTIIKNVDLKFGYIAIPATSGGTIILDPLGIHTSGGIAPPATTSSASAAKFTISGQSDYTYTVSLSDSCTISSGSNILTISGFTTSPAVIGTLVSGSQILTIGATLNIPAAQPAGTYRNAAGAEITVNYN